eukprot:s1861_g4.t1
MVVSNWDAPPEKSHVFWGPPARLWSFELALVLEWDRMALWQCSVFDVSSDGLEPRAMCCTVMPPEG